MRQGVGRLALVILSSALLLGACNYFQVAQDSDDKAIASAIQAKLFEDPVLKTRDIRVASEKGVVMLSGTVSTELERAAVERFASQAKGVKQVVNQLSVRSATTEPVATTELAEATPPPTPTTTPDAARAKPPRRVEPKASEAEAPARAETAAATPHPATTQPVETPAAPPKREPVSVTIPAGTVLTVRLIDSIDSEQHRAGEEFAATVAAPVVIDDQIVIRKGADARVRLVQARTAGRMTGRSELQVELVGLEIASQIFAVESSVYEKMGASRGKRTAATVGGGAALGGLVGAIAGKGKGAAIGAAVGAGAGTAVQAATKGQQVQIPSETKLDFTLKVPITVTM